MIANSNKETVRRTIPLLEHTLGMWNGIKQGTLGVEVTNTTHLIGRVGRAFNLQAWRDAIAALKSRHEVLGSQVVDGLKGPEFVPGGCNDDHCMLMDASDAAVRGTAQEIVSDLVWRRFDVSREGLMRTFAVAVSESDVIVGIVVNHFVADLCSIEIIGREVLQSYVAFASGRRPQRVTPAFQYFDYLADTRLWLQGEQARRCAEFRSKRTGRVVELAGIAGWTGGVRRCRRGRVRSAPGSAAARDQAHGVRRGRRPS